MKKQISKLVTSLKNKSYIAKAKRSVPGSEEWLIGTELKYGGLVSKVPRLKVSPLDHRTKERLAIGGMKGGDRMLTHGYSAKYAEYLQPFVSQGRELTLAEFGILKGTGLAIWCDLVKKGRVLGFDIDLGHINSNMDFLKSCGAFEHNKPELYEFDQLVVNSDIVGDALKGSKIDICIDDGLHSIDSIMRTMESVLPHLADEFVYFIEDNSEVHEVIREKYPHLKVDNEGQFTVVCP